MTAMLFIGDIVKIEGRQGIVHYIRVTGVVGVRIFGHDNISEWPLGQVERV